MSKRNITVGIHMFGLYAGVVVSACGSAAPTETQTAQQANTAVQARRTEPARQQTVEADRCVPNAAIYFGFDSTDLDSMSRDKLTAAAACMRDGNKRLTVTGMTDPRGTEEYNLALGDRRAQTSVGYLTSMGVEGGRIAKHSYGEEYAHDNDESQWSNDRRAEVKVE